MKLATLFIHSVIFLATASLCCVFVSCDTTEYSSPSVCKDTGNCTDITSDLCKEFPHLQDICADTCAVCECQDTAQCSQVTNVVCAEHSYIRERCQKSCGVCKNSVDNLFIIGGGYFGSWNSDVELISLQRNNEICNIDQLDIGYQVEAHASVSTRLGVITCGGAIAPYFQDGIKNCTLLTKNGQTREFPSMIHPRKNFGLALNNDKLFAIGDETMETIDINGDQWTEDENTLQVWNSGHCVVSVNNKIIVLGGDLYVGRDWTVGTSTWILNTLNNTWVQGPSMNENRTFLSCFHDGETNSVYVVGGTDGSWNDLATTEKWNMKNNMWEYAPDFPVAITMSHAVASKSKKYTGFVAGGSTRTEISNKIWGLERKSNRWIEMDQRLKKERCSHTMVNVASGKIPGC